MPLGDQAATRRRFVVYFASVGLSTSVLPGLLWEQLLAQETGRPAKEPRRLTTAMLNEALAVAGLEFTEDERQQMLNGANQSLNRYAELRRVPSI